MLRIEFLDISYEITFMHMLQNPTGVKSTLWFRQWLGAVRQQAITWTNVDQDMCRHLASLGLNELNKPVLANVCTNTALAPIELSRSIMPQCNRPGKLHWNDSNIFNWNIDIWCIPD